ncbi:hypothetical protein F4808DRAFT_28693 [Astrocystis sublimbata]|nr:hypothetical protein F4808DRAFT_28693 [Astrocystis sublimbata]
MQGRQDIRSTYARIIKSNKLPILCRPLVAYRSHPAGSCMALAPPKRRPSDGGSKEIAKEVHITIPAVPSGGAKPPIKVRLASTGSMGYGKYETLSRLSTSYMLREYDEENQLSLLIDGPHHTIRYNLVEYPVENQFEEDEWTHVVQHNVSRVFLSSLRSNVFFSLFEGGRLQLPADPKLKTHTFCGDRGPGWQDILRPYLLH